MRYQLMVNSQALLHYPTFQSAVESGWDYVKDGQAVFVVDNEADALFRVDWNSTLNAAIGTPLPKA